MIGLRVSETININLTDLRSQSGHELLTVMGTGAEPALIPLAVPCSGPCATAPTGAARGTLLLNRHGERLRPAAAGNGGQLRVELLHA